MNIVESMDGASYNFRNCEVPLPGEQNAGTAVAGSHLCIPASSKPQQQKFEDVYWMCIEFSGPTFFGQLYGPEHDPGW